MEATKNPAPTLADLINQVRHEDGVTLETIARRAGIPLSTIGAWSVGTRGARRAPSTDLLDKLAKGLQRPAPVVYEAAGRIHPSRLDSDEAAGIYIARLYGELSERDKELAREFLLTMRRSTRDAAG